MSAMAIFRQLATKVLSANSKRRWISYYILLRVALVGLEGVAIQWENHRNRRAGTVGFDSCDYTH